VRASFLDPLLYEDVNVRGTIQVLQAAARHGVPRFVFGSSSSVYGASPRTPFREDDTADRPLSPYAASKRAAEHFAYAWSHAHGLEVVCLRFFTVYGPRQRPDMAIPKFTACIERGEPIPVYGDGTQGRDFTFVADIVSGIVAAVTEPVRGFEVFNLGRGELVELNLVLDTLQELLGKKARIEHLPPQLGDAPVTLASIESAAERLRYAPQISIREGLERWVEWWRQQ